MKEWKSDAERAKEDYLGYLWGLVKECLAHYKGKLPKAVLDELTQRKLVGPGGVRQIFGEIDLKFFARAYFPEYFTLPVGEFHDKAYAELRDLLNSPPSGARLVRAWPRSFGKSSIYSFFVPTNAILYGKRPFVVMCSDTESQAESFMADIKHAIENNERILEDFGEAKGGVWRADEIIVRSANGEDCKLVAVGAESAIRGLRHGQYRPKMVIVDDLENDETVLTAERVNKRHTWFQRALIPLGDATTDFVCVGTVMAYDCVLDRILRNPTWDAAKLAAVINWSGSQLWSEWQKLYTDISLPKDERVRRARKFFEKHREEMLAGTEVLWEEGRPYVELMETLVDIGEVAFWAEYQNDPVDPGSLMFDEEWFHYYDDDELARVRIVEVVGALDPALGKSRLGDFTAIVTVGRGSNGVMYVLDAAIERMPPDRTIDVVIEKHKQFNYTRFGVEVNVFQELLRLQLAKESAQRGVYVPLVEIRHNKDKVIRVQSLVPFVKNGYVRFRTDQAVLLQQLKLFPKGRWDDGPDALQQAVGLLAKGPAIDPVMTGEDVYDGYSESDDDDEPPLLEAWYDA